MNALTGLPLREQLLDARLRGLLADLMAEGLSALRAAGIRPARATLVPASWMPALLRLPTPLFRVLAASSLRIDPLARSSMWEDLQRGRKTEVDFLNGEVVALARRKGLRAPMNERVVTLVREAEGRERYQPLAVEALAAKLAAGQ